jgi:hypothetical protein
MSGTANLNAPFIQAAQNQKEVTANAAFARFDGAITDTLALSVAASGISPGAEEVRAAFRILISGATTAGRQLSLPVIEKPTWISLTAASTKSIEVVRGTTIFTLYPGASMLVVTDGTTNGMIRLAEHGLDVSRLWVRGAPSSSELLARFKVQEPTVLLPDLMGWDVGADIAATGTSVFDVRKNGTTVGTVTFAAAATVPTYATTSNAAQSFAAGDYIDLRAPSSVDATLSNIFFRMLLIRS